MVRVTRAHTAELTRGDLAAARALLDAAFEELHRTNGSATMTGSTPWAASTFWSTRARSW